MTFNYKSPLDFKDRVRKDVPDLSVQLQLPNHLEDLKYMTLGEHNKKSLGHS